MNTYNLNQLSLEQAAQWSFPVKAGCLLGMLILLLALEYFWFINPTFQELHLQVGQEQALKADIEIKRNQAATLVNLRRRITTINQQLGALMQQLLAKNTLSTLIEKVSKMALEVGLEIESFMPQDALQHDFYKQIPIKICLKGDYFQLATLVSRLAQKRNIITIQQFIIEPMPTTNADKSSTEQLMMHITAFAYQNSVNHDQL